MGLPDKETPPQPSLRIHSQEVDSIFQGRKNLDDITALAQYATQYKNLGWSPVALDAHTGTDMKVDFGHTQTTLFNLLMDIALKKTRVSLAIRLEPDSQLFVLRVNPAFGKAFLDSLRDWRSPCIARAGDIWEHHFLVLPQSWRLSPRNLNDDQDAPMSVIGTGKVVVVPPSVDQFSHETWHWLHPPWQQPPRHPTPRLLLLLEEGGYISRKTMAEEDLPAWEDIYPLICHSNKLLQALLTPVATRELYYRNILDEALQAGFRDPRMLQGLLWHAPHGEAGHDSEGQQKLSQWAAEIQRLLSTEAWSAGSGFSGRESCVSAPPSAASTPGTEAESRPTSPLLRERAETAATPPSSENRWHELNVLEAIALELEQQVDKLERQHLSSEVGSGSSSSPSLNEKSASPSLTALENGGDLEQLRRAVQEFLLKNQGLLDSE